MLRAVLPMATVLAVAGIAVAIVASTGDEPAARAAERRVTIVLDDFRYRPQTIRARPGRLTVVLRSRARLGHNFNLRRGGRRPFATVSPIKPGARETKRLNLERGDYRMFCSIANHEELGMYGTLTVR